MIPVQSFALRSSSCRGNESHEVENAGKHLAVPAGIKYKTSAPGRAVPKKRGISLGNREQQKNRGSL